MRVQTMIESILSGISRLLNRVGSSKELQPHERMVVDAWRQTLPPDMQRVLDAQLQAADLVQRQAEGAKVCFYYPKQFGGPLFGNLATEVHVATVMLSDSFGGKENSMRAKIFLVKGRFFSIEYPKRPKRYTEQHNMDMTTLRVVSVEAHADLNVTT
jgi:hypothetical protein